MFRTHLAFSFLIALFCLKIFSIQYPILFVMLVTLLGSLPDIDTTKSKIGRKLWFISIPISFVFKHRGFFHSVFPALILFFVLRAFGWYFLAFTVLIAYLGHLVGDALTVEGVNFLHPLSTFRIQGFLRTGSMFELVILGVILAADVFFGLKMLHIV